MQTYCKDSCQLDVYRSNDAEPSRAGAFVKSRVKNFGTALEVSELQGELWYNLLMSTSLL